MTRRSLPLAAVFALAVSVSAAPVPKTADSPHLDLKKHTNVKLDENLHSENYPNNNLKALPVGKQKLGGVEFNVVDGVMQLGSSGVDKPEAIKDVPVGKTAAKVHFLMGCGYSAGKEAVIGKYVVHYDDKEKSTADIDIVYGVDVVDWWAYPTQEAPTTGKVAWEGENEASKGFEAKLRLYLKTWANPKPDVRIASIDFVAADPKPMAAPFCVAVTLEAK